MRQSRGCSFSPVGSALKRCRPACGCSGLNGCKGLLNEQELDASPRTTLTVLSAVFFLQLNLKCSLPQLVRYSRYETFIKNCSWCGVRGEGGWKTQGQVRGSQISCWSSCAPERHGCLFINCSSTFLSTGERILLFSGGKKCMASLCPASY